MKIELSKDEISIIKKCLISVEYLRMALNFGDTDIIYGLFEKLEAVSKENKSK